MIAQARPARHAAQMRALASIAILCLAATAADAACPAQDLSAQKDPLYERLKASTSELQGIPIAQEIWSLYSTAPDARAQDLLDRGVRYLQRGQYNTSETLLTELIDYCPDYAEGWNQRAFARYLDGDYAGAQTDLDRTLELEPRHFGALSGKGLTYLKQGKRFEAEQAVRRALKVNPWLNERRILPPDEKI